MIYIIIVPLKYLIIEVQHIVDFLLNQAVTLTAVFVENKFNVSEGNQKMFVVFVYFDKNVQ